MSLAHKLNKSFKALHVNRSYLVLPFNRLVKIASSVFWLLVVNKDET
jgi:hypothetical protein